MMISYIIIINYSSIYHLFKKYCVLHIVWYILGCLGHVLIWV